jgi:hypothetical protein
MAAIQVFMTGKWALVGRRLQQPRFLAKALPAGAYSGSVDLARIGIPASFGLSAGSQVNCIRPQHFPDDDRCHGSTLSANPQLELRR